MTATTWDEDFDPAHPDLQHEPPGECTTDPADTEPPGATEYDPGELPRELPDPEPEEM